ncbi:hypothetical protein STEG23_008409, partial [Scotinomys teguina]
MEADAKIHCQVSEQAPGVQSKREKRGSDGETYRDNQTKLVVTHELWTNIYGSSMGMDLALCTGSTVHFNGLVCYYDVQFLEFFMYFEDHPSVKCEIGKKSFPSLVCKELCWDFDGDCIESVDCF